jgi:hypothetical protein
MMLAMILLQMVCGPALARDKRTAEEDAAVKALEAWETSFEGRVLRTDALLGPYLAVTSARDGYAHIDLLDQRTGEVVRTFDGRTTVVFGTSEGALALEQGPGETSWTVIDGASGSLPGRTVTALVHGDRLLALQQQADTVVLHDIAPDGTDAALDLGPISLPVPLDPGTLTVRDDRVWGVIGDSVISKSMGGEGWVATIDPGLDHGSPLWHLEHDHAIAAWGQVVVRLGTSGVDWHRTLAPDPASTAQGMVEAEGAVVVWMLGVKRHRRLAVLDAATGEVRRDNPASAKGKPLPWTRPPERVALAATGETSLVRTGSGLYLHDLATGKKLDYLGFDAEFVGKVYGSFLTPSGDLVLRSTYAANAHNAKGEHVWTNSHGLDGSTCDRIMDAKLTAVAMGVVTMATAELHSYTSDGSKSSQQTYHSLQRQGFSTLFGALDVSADGVKGGTGAKWQSPNLEEDIAALSPKLAEEFAKAGGVFISPEYSSMTFPVEVRSVWTGPASITAYQTRDISGFDQTPCSEADLLVIDTATGDIRTRLPLHDEPDCAAAVAVDEQAGLAYEAFSPHHKKSCGEPSLTLRALQLP